MALDEQHKLRKLAEWYRGWAAVGNDEDRPSRIRHAEYLERRADHIEATCGAAQAGAGNAGRNADS
jgi:hypothetical protein